MKRAGSGYLAGRIPEKNYGIASSPERREVDDLTGRYSRQELFHPIGPDGQEKLSRARVLVIGAGALGAASAEMLVRAGVGSLTIADRDYVEWSNLQRQQLYTEQDVIDHMPKAAAAEKRLRLINSSVQVTGIVADVTAEKALELAEEASLIVDANG